MGSCTTDLQDPDGTQVAAVGGKGASLGELARIDGVDVPPGFCVRTDAYRAVLRDAPAMDGHLRRLAGLRPDDADGIAASSAEARRTLEETPVPAGVEAAIRDGLQRLGVDAAYAVRSSATAEDSPTASFAGQHDTALNVVGPDAVLAEVRRCWASVFTDRAVSYRLRRGLDHRDALMAVVVQRMVLPHASGICFTADPLTGDRTVVCVESGPGLGEALVSGLVDPDVHAVRGDEVVRRTIATKRLTLRPARTGGVEEQSIAGAQREEPALTDAQVVALAHLGRRIEAHVGAPQDIEWCLADGAFLVVQSRPITTLFPVPEADDDDPHVYLSVGHQQMMTDPMKALGLSVHRAVAIPRMHEAGGRLFVDVAPRLASPAGAEALVAMWQEDPLTAGALRTVVDRGFVPTVPDEDGGPAPTGAPAPGEAPAPPEADPALVAALQERTRSSLATLERDIAAVSGPALVAFIQEDALELKRLLTDPESFPVLMGGMDASAWLNERMAAWLGETNAADALTLSAPGNVTSEMGLALLDVADVVRPHPEVVAFLEGVEDEAFLERMADLDGGPEAQDAISDYLDRYGMRCVGEIDVTRPRWSERPSTLLPLLLANVRTFTAGEGRRRFAQGAREAAATEVDLLARLRALPDGAAKAEETARMTRRVRTFIGYREFPKYGMVRRYAIWKRALLVEAGRLVAAGVLSAEEDLFHLTLDEVAEVLRTDAADRDLIARRAAAFRAFQDLTPPRLITSDGEVLTGSYGRDGVPDGALAGLAVSRGTVEGRARVVLEMVDADLEPGDVLVTAYTDPSWSPLFVAAAALVTEVGGLMTHGAVVAREYGLPAVVGVEEATRVIRDGQRIRVHGTDGFVELLD